MVECKYLVLVRIIYSNLHGAHRPPPDQPLARRERITLSTPFACISHAHGFSVCLGLGFGLGVV